MATGKVMERVRDRITANVLAHSDNDFNDYDVINKKTGKAIRRVITANIKAKCVKVWTKDKDGNRCTKFLENLELAWRPKQKKSKKKLTT